MKNFLRRLRKDESGASLVEYVVLLGVVLAVTLAAITAIGGEASRIFGLITAALKLIV
ncbi:MAG: Flp family type IVb pilin [Beijerinckiaceae bacterium]|nr:Flp family type IVb pilin [Beijerinckiaceae bacterium]MCI0736467.1 Flp family type IVb pilin [Beijerinckiaceae bacterium]